MNQPYLLHHLLWGVQAFLALFFLGAGVPKISGRGIDRWTGFSDLPRSLTVFIGTVEILGAAGLVVPMATGVLPWFTPLAAVGLALVVLLAAGFHLRADERLEAVESGLWASIAAVIAIGRWSLLASHVANPAWALVGAIVLLVPTTVAIVVVLLRRPARTTIERAHA
jgi:hypothetical protein